MTMAEREGVIKYRLEHRTVSMASNPMTRQINAWRHIFYKLALIGHDPTRYQGLGFGNISQRLAPGTNRFLITGSQTGYLAYLKPEHFATIENAVPAENTLVSSGPCRPSSEAMTHASIYQAAADVQAVIHVHSPEIWRNTHTLDLPYTAAHISYGSVEMTNAVDQLFRSDRMMQKPIFSMLGHEDGIVAFGSTLPAAAQTLLQHFAAALAIEQSQDTV